MAMACWLAGHARRGFAPQAGLAAGPGLSGCATAIGAALPGSSWSTARRTGDGGVLERSSLVCVPSATARDAGGGGPLAGVAITRQRAGHHSSSVTTDTYLYPGWITRERLANRLRDRLAAVWCVRRPAGAEAAQRVQRRRLSNSRPDHSAASRCCSFKEQGNPAFDGINIGTSDYLRFLPEWNAASHLVGYTSASTRRDTAAWPARATGFRTHRAAGALSGCSSSTCVVVGAVSSWRWNAAGECSGCWATRGPDSGGFNSLGFWELQRGCGEGSMG